MILLVPENRVCPGKTTRFPITNYNPVIWIKTENQSYSVITIDGFIVNNHNNVNGIFKKLEYIEEIENEELTLNHITEVISANELTIVSQLANILQCGFFVFIWPKNYPLGFPIEQRFIHSFKLNNNGNQLQIERHSKLNLNHLEEGIRKLRGFSFSRVKNLNSASSNVECHLANNTTNPWPGDIDALIFNNETQRFDAIIEFKTHNMDTPIQNERIGKYGQEDWRRFNVLFDLIDNFNNRFGYKPKLFFIIWGTNEHSAHHANIKIDVIERNNVVNTTLFPRPDYNVFSQDLFDFLIERINEA